MTRDEKEKLLIELIMNKTDTKEIKDELEIKALSKTWLTFRNKYNVLLKEEKTPEEIVTELAQEIHNVFYTPLYTAPSLNKGPRLYNNYKQSLIKHN